MTVPTKKGSPSPKAHPPKDTQRHNSNSTSDETAENSAHNDQTTHTEPTKDDASNPSIHINIADAETTVPTPVIPPNDNCHRTNAGVKITYLLLLISVVAITYICVIFALTYYNIGTNMMDAYKPIIENAILKTERQITPSIDALIDTINSNAPPAIERSELKSRRKAFLVKIKPQISAVLFILETSEALPQTLKDSVRRCDFSESIPITRAGVNDCLNSLTSLRLLIGSNSTKREYLSGISDSFAKNLREARHDFASTWIQYAQSILLNLLLPLLTALLGYIFGSREGSRSND